ncbi:hypothetical protein IGI04_011492, partial [Brassica rapa subsp. trilocularis]
MVPRNFLGIFRGNSEEHMFGVSKHQFFLPYIISYTNAMHTIEKSLNRNPKSKTLNRRKSLGIFRGFSEEV